jgi:hypothetical protein
LRSYGEAAFGFLGAVGGDVHIVASFALFRHCRESLWVCCIAIEHEMLDARCAKKFAVIIDKDFSSANSMDRL